MHLKEAPSQPSSGSTKGFPEYHRLADPRSYLVYVCCTHLGNSNQPTRLGFLYLLELV